MKKHLLFAFLILCTGFNINLSAQQKIYIQNPSFEDATKNPTGGQYSVYTPPPWQNCFINNQAFNCAANAGTPDLNTQNAFGITPSEGSFYMGVWAGNDTSANCHGGEAFYQLLCEPMKKGVTYSFSIDVSCQNYWSFSPPVASDTGYFGVYGANNLTPGAMLNNPTTLFHTKVNSISWTKYTVTFTPDSSYQYLIIGAWSARAPLSWLPNSKLPYLNFDNITDIATSCGVTASVAGGTVCSGSCFNLTATGTSGTPPYTYSWLPGNFSGAGPHNVCPVIPTTYTVLITDNSGTSSTATALVDVKALSVDAGNDTTLCGGGTVPVSATASGPASFTWSPSPGLSCTGCPNPAASVSSTTTYTVTASDGTCISVDSVTITVNAPPVADISLPAELCAKKDGTVRFTGSASSTATYVWDFGGGTPVSGSGQGPYEITWNSSGQASVKLIVIEPGCPADTAEWMVLINKCDVIVPNIITNDPNGNNRFLIDGLENYPGTKLRIYNRWGTLIYEDDNYGNDWFAKNSRGGNVTDGVYYYILFFNDETTATGFVTVLREQRN